MEKIGIGIIGYGTIGASVDKLIKENRSEILKKTGLKLEVLSVCDVSPKAKHPLLTRRASELIENPDILVVVEAIGGEHPALEFILESIRMGKHVVTSNKEVMALHADEIFAEAREYGVSVRFEASVGGGIPILSSLIEDLAANNIREVYGIVNGTTNFILTKMMREGIDFGDALKEAQNLGYAEANPKKDIEGYDASYKAAILSMSAFGKMLKWKNIYFEGISNISKEDMEYAFDMGYVIKLLAIVKNLKNEVEARVHPTLIPKDHPLASVNGPMNAIYVKGDFVGELMFYGAGAGGDATASAVVSDIIATATNRSDILRSNIIQVKTSPIDEISCRYYIRLQAFDKHGVLAGISKAFSDEKVSIAAVFQKETIGGTATIVILMHEAKEKNMQKALNKIKKLSVVKKISNVIRVGL